jgi:hypothetical protein
VYHRRRHPLTAGYHEERLDLKTKTDLPAMMALTMVLWLCSLVLVGLVVAPLFGPRVAWIVAIGLLLVFLALCWGVCAYRLVDHKVHEPRR